MSNDLRALRLDLIGNWQSLLLDLLGKPSRRTARQWRWNRRGSLSAVMSGPKAGTWFDHEAGCGGGPLELIVRVHGGDWRDAADWARAWLGLPRWEPRCNAHPAGAAVQPIILIAANDAAPNIETERREAARRAAAVIWEHADPADPDHPYLQRKQVQPFGIRMCGWGRLILPLVDLDGTIHTFQDIDENGTKRFQPGGAKANHFVLIGGPLEGAATILLCEGWATGATLHEASGLPVIAAMDAGNLKRVAPLVHERFPEAHLVIIADNDDKPGRVDNPGVAAATAAARSVGAWIAIPPEPGDANDLAAKRGLDAVRDCIAAAAPLPPPVPTYPPARLSLPVARLALDARIAVFMADVERHWRNETLNTDDIAAADIASPPWFAAMTVGDDNVPHGPACR